MPLAETTEFEKAVFEAIRELLVDHRSVRIPSFGEFRIEHRAAAAGDSDSDLEGLAPATDSRPLRPPSDVVRFYDRHGSP